MMKPFTFKGCYRYGTVIAAFITAFTLSSCASLSSSGKESTRLQIALQASTNVNPDSLNRPAPILVRVYELKSPSSFREADFFALQKDDKSALGDDLVTRDEFIIEPGKRREISRHSSPETKAIGIIAGYRNISGSVWKKTYVLQEAPDAAWYRIVIPSNKAELNLVLDRNAIRFAQQAKPAKKPAKQPARRIIIQDDALYRH